MKFDIIGVLPSRRGTCTKDNAPVPADYGHLVPTTIQCLLLALLIHRWRNEDRNRRVVVLTLRLSTRVSDEPVRSWIKHEVGDVELAIRSQVRSLEISAAPGRRD